MRATRAAVPAPAELPPPLGARVGMLATAVCGVLALFSTVLADTADVAAFAVTCAIVFAAAAWAPVIWPTPGGITVRRLLSFTLLATTLVLSFVNLVRVDPSDVASFATTFGGFLGRLLISVLLAQLFVTDKMRDLRVALLLAIGMFVLAVGNEPGSVVVVALVVGWPAVVTVLAFDHAGREQAKADTVARAAPTAQTMGWARVGWFAAVSGVVAVLLVLLVPHPTGVRPRQAAGGAGGGGAPVPTSAAPSRNPSAYTLGSLDMRARGNLPGTAVADVPLDSPQLWRGAVLDYYDGISWSAPADSSSGRQLSGGPHFDLPIDDTTFGTGAERRDVVRKRVGFTGVLLAPGQPSAVDLAGGFLRLPGGLFISQPRGGAADSYTVTSRTTDLPHSELSQTPVAMPAGQGAPGYALELPNALPERVRLLGERITRWSTDRDAATRAIEDYLRAHETYRLDSPVPPPGEDAVDHFLFVAHTGFCEQFAAAEVVLLRSVGVPARLATGFAGGEPSGDHRTLIGTDAHAWVEVWYPGIGWAASDPTAGTRPADPGLRDRASSWLRGAAGRLVVAGCLLVVATLVALLVGWLRRRARRVRDGRGARQPAGRPLPPVLAAFDRLQRALDEAGTPRAPAESVGELARRPAMRPAAGALAVVERTSYGARAPVGAEAADAERTLNELARQVRAELAASDPRESRAAD